MNIIQKGLNFYVNSSLHVAVSVISLSHLTMYSYKTSPSIKLQVVLFCATVMGYNFVKYFGLTRFYYRSLTTRLREIQILSLCCFIGFISFFFNLKWNTKITLCILCFVTFLYANPIGPFSNLRQIKGLKIYIIALVWTLVTVLTPILESGILIQLEVCMAMLQRFIFILILMLPFEIRDMNFDDLKLSTIPQLIGIKQTKIVGFLGIGMLAFFMLYERNELPISGSIIVLLLLIYTLIKSDPKRDLNFTAFWVEGIPIIWCIYVIILDSI